MKKMISMFLSLVLLCAAFTASAEANDPLYATVSDALAAAGEFPVTVPSLKRMTRTGNFSRPPGRRSPNRWTRPMTPWTRM